MNQLLYLILSHTNCCRSSRNLPRAIWDDVPRGISLQSLRIQSLPSPQARRGLETPSSPTAKAQEVVTEKCVWFMRVCLKQTEGARVSVRHTHLTVP